MREILFKARRLDNSEWVEGYYMKLNGHHYILIGKLDIMNGYPELVKYVVNPKTICQYTGLTDKNGKKIWENDIVTATWYSYIEPEDEITGVVIFNGCWCAYSIFDESNHKMEELNGVGAYKFEIEVLGNMFDNPELLEG